jgi:hypothetical protein
MTRPTKPTETPAASISPDALEALLANMAELKATVAKYAAEAEATQKAMTEKPKLSVAGKTQKQIQNEIQCVRAFKKAGFGTVTPHVNVKTYNRWILENRRPVEGSKSIKAGGLRLFHLSQTRELTSEEKATREDQPKAAEARKAKGKGAKVVNINEAHPQ